jgi:hypothetical protein
MTAAAVGAAVGAAATAVATAATAVSRALLVHRWGVFIAMSAYSFNSFIASFDNMIFEILFL